MGFWATSGPGRARNQRASVCRHWILSRPLQPPSPASDSRRRFLIPCCLKGRFWHPVRRSRALGAGSCADSEAQPRGAPAPLRVGRGSARAEISAPRAPPAWPGRSSARSRRSPSRRPVSAAWPRPGPYFGRSRGLRVHESAAALAPSPSPVTRSDRSLRHGAVTVHLEPCTTST